MLNLLIFTVKFLYLKAKICTLTLKNTCDIFITYKIWLEFGNPLVLIGKTVKAVTAPATVKGDDAYMPLCLHGKAGIQMIRKSGDLPDSAFVDFREDYLK